MGRLRLVRLPDPPPPLTGSLTNGSNAMHRAHGLATTFFWPHRPTLVGCKSYIEAFTLLKRSLPGTELRAATRDTTQQPKARRFAKRSHLHTWELAVMRTSCWVDF